MEWMEWSARTQLWVNLILLWIGFGAVVGFIANWCLPSRSPLGFFSTLAIGITGSCIGPLLLALFLKPQPFHPMGPLGFVVAIATSVILLICSRSLMFFARKREKKVRP